MTDRDPRAILEADLRARRDMRGAPLARATWQLVLGELDESLETLRTAHRDLADERAKSERIDLLALLVGDRDGARQHAASALERATAAWAAGWRHYQGAMLAILAEADERAAEQVKQLEAYALTHDRLPSGPPTTISAIPAGILAAEPARASAGLDALLAWHLRSARSRSGRFNSANGVISTDAVIALLVAHGRGLTLGVDAKYRRATVPMLAVMIKDWAGRPLDRLTELSLDTDLVAGPWLANVGLDLGAAPTAAPGAARRVQRKPTRRPADANSEAVVEFLRKRVTDGLGSRWQLISWALVAGDVLAARRNLALALSEARRQLEESRPQQSGILRRLWRSQGLPNQNYVREHFGLALAAGDHAALDESGRLLRAWMDAVQEDERRQGRSLHPPYAHAAGYLDYAADLLGPNGPRAPADRVSSLPRNLYAACVGLERRDASVVEEAIETTLEEHARQLERKTSPPAPLCLPAIQVAALARRIGLSVRTDPKWASWSVPISLRERPGTPDRVGRAPADLLGRALFALDEHLVDVPLVQE